MYKNRRSEERKLDGKKKEREKKKEEKKKKKNSVRLLEEFCESRAKWNSTKTYRNIYG